MEAINILYMCALVLMLLGLYTRWATIIVWLSHIFIMNAGHLSIYGVDRYMHVFLFYLVFAPSGKTWSIDAWRNGTLVSVCASNRFFLRVLQIQLSLTYLNAGLAKMYGSDWWNGEAIWRVINMPEFRQFDMTWIASFPALLLVLCWGTLFF